MRSEFLTLKDLSNLYRDWLDMTQARGATATNFMSEREMLSSLKAAFPTLAAPDMRVNTYTDDGRRAKARPVYGITANEAEGAFLVLRDGLVPAGSGWMGMPTAAAPRTRVGIPHVEEWREKQDGRASGLALVGGAVK